MTRDAPARQRNGRDRLRIAQIAPLWASVPPSHYGGIELMTYLLTEQLVRRGHEVTLYAAGDSSTSAHLRSVCPGNLLDAIRRGAACDHEYYANALFAEAMADSSRYDLIHCQGMPAQIPYSRFILTPVLYTIRTVMTVDDAWLLARHPEAHVTVISNAQAGVVDSHRRRSIRVVYNSCDFDSYELGSGSGGYLAWLGRMTPRKGAAEAVALARAVGIPLVLAGAPETRKDREYFESQLKPLIDGSHVSYVGPVDHREKNDLLKDATALIFPISWAEPFGNVMIEAMACGTPVVAHALGSVPEVVDVGVTGYYSRSLDGMTGLIDPALALDRTRVRDHARDRFGHERMADDYEAVYAEMLAGMSLEEAGKT